MNLHLLLPRVVLRVGPVDNLPGMAYRRLNDRDWTMLFVCAGCEDLTGHEPMDLVLSAEVDGDFATVPEADVAIPSATLPSRRPGDGDVRQHP